MVLDHGRRIILLTLTATLIGCASLTGHDSQGPVPRGYYRIRSGDTLSEIAQRRRIPMRRLAEWNRLDPPYQIYAGNLLRVRPPASQPAGERTASAMRTKAAAAPRPAPTTPVPQTSPAPRSGPAIATATPAGRGSAAAASGLTWQWPVRGPLRQTYVRDDRTRSGLRIGVAPGTPVGAAAAGTVVYSGSGLKGYGNLIIVQHNTRYLSAYGYNRRLLVTEGEQVRGGQVLAEAGQAADGQSLLHFEIRRDGQPVDPLRYLPASR
ncbi:MAG: LysM peptidoglycan-binding domain-containing protein [Chromatiaceae bacterium]|nr:MAG: LysM peptidoglycan-binding domain-containing protein [Chromatiaceae bacterium]